MTTLLHKSIVFALFFGLFLCGSAPAQDDEASATDLLKQYRARGASDAASRTSGIRVKDPGEESPAPETEDESAEPEVGVQMTDPDPVFVGIVGQKALTRGTLQKRAEAQLGPQTAGLDDDEYRIQLRQAEDAILREWAVNEVLSEVARDRGIAVSRAEVADRLAELAEAAGFPGEPEVALAKFGMDIRDYIGELEQAILTEKLVFQVLDENLGEGFWKRLYEANRQEFYTPKRVRLRAIVRDLSTGRTDADVVAMIEDMQRTQKKLRRGGDFAEEASVMSDAVYSGARGGDMGWIGPSNKLAAPWNERVFEMVPGRVSDVLMSGDGRYLYIFRVEEKQEESYASFEEARRELYFLVYDDAREELYIEQRTAFRILLNASGLNDSQLAKIERDELRYF